MRRNTNQRLYLLLPLIKEQLVDKVVNEGKGG